MVSWATVPVLAVMGHGHRPITMPWKWLRMYIPGTASSPVANAPHSLLLPSFDSVPNTEDITIDEVWLQPLPCHVRTLLQCNFAATAPGPTASPTSELVAPPPSPPPHPPLSTVSVFSPAARPSDPNPKGGCVESLPKFLQWLNAILAPREQESAKSFHLFMNLTYVSDCLAVDFPTESLYSQWEYL